ncbi:hypothetical protein ACJ73_00481 [Blastomyces percursus]|uniref:Uncharacterized protein n=1 Tax=Blastomyces percursus TaxID=1658174 RepID=A0A1J9RHT1_9EURO|nr:hypothetical protein ACJ73_00481 [Blastomyces percursus]
MPIAPRAMPAPLDVNSRNLKDTVLGGLISQMDGLTLAIAEIQKQRDTREDVAAPKVLLARGRDPALDLSYDRPMMTCWGCGDSNHMLPNCMAIGHLIDQGQIHRNMHGEYFEGNVIRPGPRIHVNRHEPHIITIERHLSPRMVIARS